MRYNRKHLQTNQPNNITSNIENIAGCYRIYLKGESINRLVGRDETGLLYIGSTKPSNGLLKRLRDFFNSATNTNAKGQPPTTHSAGKFYQLYDKNHLGNAINVLEFEFDIKNADIDAVNAEAIQLEQYLLTYGELPPLNHQLPKII